MINDFYIYFNLYCDNYKFVSKKVDVYEEELNIKIKQVLNNMNTNELEEAIDFLKKKRDIIVTNFQTAKYVLDPDNNAPNNLRKKYIDYYKEGHSMVWLCTVYINYVSKLIIKNEKKLTK